MAKSYKEIYEEAAQKISDSKIKVINEEIENNVKLLKDIVYRLRHETGPGVEESCSMVAANVQYSLIACSNSLKK